MATDRHFRFLKVANEMASKTKDMRRGFGCVLVNKNKIVSMGRNYKSHTKVPTDVVAHNQLGEKISYFGLHAEISALLKCEFSVKGMTAYIWGRNVKTGSLVNSEPCPLCKKVLKERGIEEAIFPLKQGGYGVKKI
jgi:dCMP deaminase